MLYIITWLGLKTFLKPKLQGKGCQRRSLIYSFYSCRYRLCGFIFRGFYGGYYRKMCSDWRC
ncbi:CT631 frame-shifted leader [Chlamydia pneumoniae J138]|nr:CT631 frame-shifted leader [Chlamydia pneumoniae J138]